jgi:hypothetical protein
MHSKISRSGCHLELANSISCCKVAVPHLLMNSRPLIASCCSADESRWAFQLFIPSLTLFSMLLLLQCCSGTQLATDGIVLCHSLLVKVGFLLQLLVCFAITFLQHRFLLVILACLDLNTPKTSSLFGTIQWWFHPRFMDVSMVNFPSPPILKRIVSSLVLSLIAAMVFAFVQLPWSSKKSYSSAIQAFRNVFFPQGTNPC